MNPGIHAATAAAAAERRRRQNEEEEERMTRYQGEDLDNDWEFKIIRSNTPVFRKPEVLQRVLEEEAIAGWKLLEKLDDQRIRLKRPASAQRRDDMLPRGVNPYRTQIGGGSATAALIVGLAMLAMFGGLVMLLGIQSSSFNGEIIMVILGIIVFLGLIVAALVAWRRGV